MSFSIGNPVDIDKYYVKMNMNVFWMTYCEFVDV